MDTPHQIGLNAAMICSPLMILCALSLVASPAEASPPPDWAVLPAPMSRGVERIAWSADGTRIAVCGESVVSVLGLPATATRATATQAIVAPHQCADIAFDGDAVVYAVKHDDDDGGLKGVWRSGLGPAAPTRISAKTAQSVLVRGTRLWVAGMDVAIFEADKVVARAPINAVRRLVETSAGVLAVTPYDVKVLDDDLKIARTLTPAPGIDAHGLFDAVELPGGRIAAVTNGGTVWIWDATGAQVAHGRSIGNARWLVWTGAALVVGQMWLQIDPLRPLARAVRQPRSVGPAAVSPDGKRIAIPLHEGVLLRSVTQPVRLPRGMPATARGIVTTPDAVWVADDYGQLIHFDRQGKVQAVHTLANGGLRDLVGDPAKTLYAGTEWGDVIAWRAQGPFRRWKNRGSDTLALTADGQTLYVGGQKTVNRFDTATGARTAMAPEPEDYGSFHPTLTPKNAVIWFRSGHPSVWHPKGKPPVKIVPGRSGGFDARGRLWVNDREAKPWLYDWPKLNRIKQLPWFDEGRFVPLADGGMVVTGWGGQVQAFTPNGDERWSKHAPWHVGGVALLKDPRGARLLTGGPDLTLSAWDLKTGARTAWAPAGRGQPVSALAFSADGRFLAVGADSTGVRVWDLKTHKMVRDLAVKAGDLYINRHGDAWLIHHYNAIERWPVTGGAAKTLPWEMQFDTWRGAQARGAFVLRAAGDAGHVVDLRTGKTQWTVTVPEGVREAKLSEDGQTVAMLVPGELMELRVQVRGKRIKSGVKGPLYNLRWQGNTLLVWHHEDGALEWTGKKLRRRPDLPIFSGRVVAAGQRLAISDATLVRIQDGTQLIRMLPIEHHGDRFVRLSPDGKTVAVGGNFTGSVVLWSVETGAPIARYEAFADGMWRSTTAGGETATGETIRKRK